MLNSPKQNANGAEKHTPKPTTDNNTAATPAQKKPKNNKTKNTAYDGYTKTKNAYTKHN